MKKRLRKKKHIGEFTEYGQRIKFVLNIPNDKFLDSFVDKVEACKCFCGGSYNSKTGIGDFIIELGSKNPMLKLMKIGTWMEVQIPDVVAKYEEIGSVFDINKDDND